MSVLNPAAELRPSRRGLMFSDVPGENWTLERGLKRVIDFSVALVLLVVLSPLLLLLALAIKLDSPGPVLIRQDRVGRRLLPFGMLKLRSMVVNAVDLQAELEALNEATPPLFKIRRDPRVTRVGRFLRRSSLDELPQLVNVLRGEMSLVGPRPPFASEVEADFLRQALRLQQVPGMTGLWQVSGRSVLGYDDMIALDLRYHREWSILVDLGILLRTPSAIFGARGAY